MELLTVDRSLGREFREIDIGAESARIEIELNRIEHAVMLIERVVARVAGQVRRESREPDIAILLRDQCIDQNVRDDSVAIAISEEQNVLLLIVDGTLHLK